MFHPDIPTEYQNQIVTGDALDFARSLPAGSVPLFLFSPPYNLGNSSGGGLRGSQKQGHYTDGTTLGKRGGGRRKGMGKRSGKWDGGALANGYDDYSDNLPWPEYIAWQKDILTDCWAALPENGAIFYQHKPRILDGVLLDPITFVPDCCIVRQRIIWARAGGINFSPSFCCPTHEYIYILARPAWRLKSKGASGVGDVWSIPQESSTWHPAPFPLALAERVLEITMPALVCDLFMGSGTTGRAAKRFGIDFIGCDRNPAYVERANQEIAKERRITLRQQPVFEMGEQMGLL